MDGSLPARRGANLLPVEPERWTNVELGPRALHKRSAVIAVLLVVAGAAFLIGHTTRPSTRDAQATPATITQSSTTTSTSAISTTTISTSGVAGTFAGVWQEHGLTMRIDPSGYGQIVFRTYTWCSDGPAPCDFIAGGDIADGGFADLTVAADSADHATGQILTSTSPSKVPIGPFDASYDADTDVLSVALHGHEPLVLCGPHAKDPPSRCG
jgi:hypothetical protein